MKKNYKISILLVALLVSACNLPSSGLINTPSENMQVTPTGPGILITSPVDGSEINADSPLNISYIASGGPFIEVDLFVDGQPVISSPVASTEPIITGSITWDKPTAGSHKIELLILTLEKKDFTASIQVNLTGGGMAVAPTVLAPATVDAGMEAARQRVIQILRDKYGVNMTAPPIGRKLRQGVTTDPWVSAVYYNDWFFSVSIYTDGTEADFAFPVNHADPNTHPEYIDPNSKSAYIHMCRPSGIIKLLVVFVDYQNLGVTSQEASDALAQAVDQINGKYVEAAHAVGLNSPILQITATGAFITPPTVLPGHLLTPSIVQAGTGYDAKQFDILVQIDLDANKTYATATNFGSFGFGSAGCGDPPVDVNMWINIDAKEQLSQTGDARLTFTLGHELLHNMGYPIGKTGVHEWVCGDGSQPDLTDQCDENNLPTLMLGWTDTDGDGVVEILDPTPYGLIKP